MNVKCDGCWREVTTDDIKFFAALGHVMRYCSECGDIWADFHKASKAEAERLQRLLDLWEKDVRAALPLKLTPLDLPKLVVDAKGRALTLA